MDKTLPKIEEEGEKMDEFQSEEKEKEKKMDKGEPKEKKEEKKREETDEENMVGGCHKPLTEEDIKMHEARIRKDLEKYKLLEDSTSDMVVPNFDCALDEKKGDESWDAPKFSDDEDLKIEENSKESSDGAPSPKWDEIEKKQEEEKKK